VDGFITQMRDVDSLAARIEELYRNPEKRQEMGKAACANAQNYSWDHYRVRLKGFLDGMLATR
jgi:glycosyltransferase involved in cell wall biosynthesis